MIDTTGISSFIEKYQTARNFGSKEIRLTLQEAESMSIALTAMLIRELDLSQKVIDLQTQIMTGVEVKQDGGRF